VTGASPDDFHHVAAGPHEPLRTFHPRRAALGRDRADALNRLWPRYGFSVHDEALGRGPRTPDGLLDTDALFGRHAPVVLEIGPGMGEATVETAADDPARDYLAVEAHLPGVANLLSLVERAGLTNVRVGHGDALQLVRESIAPSSLAAVHAFFPDPWPKARHHKRRLIQPDHVQLLREHLVIGGILHTATDWADYAEQMREVLTADPCLADASADPQAARRRTTKFERLALAQGRTAVDLVVRRVC